VASALNDAGARVIVTRERTYREPRPHAASEGELARHAAFLATLADPIWVQTR